jgi:uncharacterized Zn finger protein (UPF0148 family)
MIKCPKCLKQYDDGIIICPYCGSENHFGEGSLKISSRVRMFGKLTSSKKVGKNKKPSLEIESGEQLQIKTNTYVTKSRTIDRENDIYKEKITDSETGEIICNVEEKLSSHTGHGTAKQSTTSKK